MDFFSLHLYGVQATTGPAIWVRVRGLHSALFLFIIVFIVVVDISCGHIRRRVFSLPQAFPWSSREVSEY